MGLLINASQCVDSRCVFPIVQIGTDFSFPLGLGEVISPHASWGMESLWCLYLLYLALTLLCDSRNNMGHFLTPLL